MDKQKLLSAIDKRCSRRSYIDRQIESEKQIKLQEIIKKINIENDLNIELIKDGRESFSSIKSSYGMFSGVNSYFALVGCKNDEYLKQKLGYYGELLVLEATSMGLGTCWIGGTYDKKNCEEQINIGEDEELIAVISVGYTKEYKTIKEKIISGLSHRKTKAIEQMYDTEEKLIPDRFIEGMKAVQRAPSAINRQPVKFNYGNGLVTAKVEDKFSYEKIDLGIAMLHFEVGTLSENTWYLKDSQYVFELR